MPDQIKAMMVETASAIVGAANVLTAEADMAGYLVDWRKRLRGEALAVVLPASTQEVAAIVRACREMGIVIVPQAGNTGFVGGAIPPENRPSVILNVSRINRICSIDVANNSVTVEAGCILATLREEVEKADRIFPMSLGSEGSCRVGGLVSTDAGGTAVIRYGNMRDLVLGLEVVLPNGQIWNGLRSLRKDNSGYDLKQLFIGAEGTLGIVTAATLKLYPRPTDSATAMVAISGLEHAVPLLNLFGDMAGRRVEAFELMSKDQIENVITHMDLGPAPMELTVPWYILIELADGSVDFRAQQLLETILARALEEQHILDAVIAVDQAKAQKIWKIRHSASEANLRSGYAVANDTSVPVARIAEFIPVVEEEVRNRIPHARLCHVGHIGDGNIHVVVILDRKHYSDEGKRKSASLLANHIVHEVSVKLDGSISAEHGIGMLHVDALEEFKSSVDLNLMRSLKRALDPDNIMNPGKIINLA